MLNAEFATSVRNSDNGHVFMKVLQERVADELGLTTETEEQDLYFKEIYDRRQDALKFDLEASYNMQDINNTEAMGYDNLGKRSGGTSDSRTFESSHESVFDKMLADYYLSQRGDYAETNKTMQQLTQVFEAKQKSKKEFRDHTYGDNI